MGSAADLPQSIALLVLNTLFDLVRNWLPSLAQLSSILGGGGLIGLATLFVTKLLPWWRTAQVSRSLYRRLGGLLEREEIERAIRFYVRQNCQDVDPSGADEPRLALGARQGLFPLLDYALTHATEFRYVWILADSGMGKTSALINYCAHHNRRWRNRLSVYFVPLGHPDSDKRIAAISDKEKAVLLLDAFDEDPRAARDNANQRLRELVEATRSFRRVLITCRTQFFAGESEIPQRTGVLKVGPRSAGSKSEYEFHTKYLSPFSEDDVKLYIRRRFPLWRPLQRLRSRRLATKIPNLSARPMLLSFLEDFLEAGTAVSRTIDLYAIIIDQWLTREEPRICKQELFLFSQRFAVDIYSRSAQRGTERVSKAELLELSDDWQLSIDLDLLTVRSLLNCDTAGNFKFAHRSIMEYLFILSAMEGKSECFDEVWTDLMVTFCWEFLERDLGLVSPGSRILIQRVIASQQQCRNLLAHIALTNTPTPLAHIELVIAFVVHLLALRSKATVIGEGFSSWTKSDGQRCHISRKGSFFHDKYDNIAMYVDGVGPGRIWIPGEAFAVAESTLRALGMLNRASQADDGGRQEWID